MAQPCTFKITFDRPDRRYAGGDPVRGSVQIAISRETKSTGIWLTHCWRAHGIGNQHEVKLDTVQLAEPELLQPGQELNYNFEVTAPRQPVTQRGSLFSVDHYIQVHIAVAWATDPSAEEDYLLEAGRLPEQLPQSRRELSLNPSWQSSGQPIGITGRVFGCLLALVFLGAIGTFFVAEPMIPIALTGLGLAVAGYFAIRSFALKRKLGNVELGIPHHVVAPGEPWLAELKFHPPRSCRINGITLTLQADESTVSGSGSDRKTHRRTAFEQIIPLREAEELPAGEAVHERLLITFPRTNVLSFEAGDNKIRWAALVRIDIPGYPDWTSTVPLQVLHPRLLSQLPPAPELGPHWQVSGEPAEAAQDRPRGIAPAASVGSSPPDTPVSSSATTTIATVIAELNSHSPHSPARGNVIRRAVGSRMAVSVTISRSASTIGAAEEDPLYAGGLTVDGTIDGTRQAIRIVALTSASAEIEALPPNASWLAEVELIDWDTIYHRINARQLP